MRKENQTNRRRHEMMIDLTNIPWLKDGSKFMRTNPPEKSWWKDSSRKLTDVESAIVIELLQDIKENNFKDLDDLFNKFLDKMVEVKDEN